MSEEWHVRVNVAADSTIWVLPERSDRPDDVIHAWTADERMLRPKTDEDLDTALVACTAWCVKMNEKFEARRQKQLESIRRVDAARERLDDPNKITVVIRDVH